MNQTELVMIRKDQLLALRASAEALVTHLNWILAASVEGVRVEQNGGCLKGQQHPQESLVDISTMGDSDRKYLCQRCSKELTFTETVGG